MPYDRSSWCERGDHASCQGKIWAMPRPFAKGDLDACRCECHDDVAPLQEALA